MSIRSLLATGVLLLSIAVPATAAQSLGEKGGNWTGEFWNLPNTEQYLSSPPSRYTYSAHVESPDVVDTNVDTIDYDLGLSAPIDGINADRYVARFTQNFTNDTQGSYTISTVSDDGISVGVSKVHDSGEIAAPAIQSFWNDHSATEKDFTFDVPAGTYQIEIMYYENGWDSVLKVADPVFTSSGVDANAPLPVATITSLQDNAVIDDSSVVRGEYYYTNGPVCNPNCPNRFNHLTDELSVEVYLFDDNGLVSLPADVNYSEQTTPYEGNEFDLSLAGLAPGEYGVRVVVTHASGATADDTVVGLVVEGDTVVDPSGDILPHVAFTNKQDYDSINGDEETLIGTLYYTDGSLCDHSYCDEGQLNAFHDELTLDVAVTYAGSDEEIAGIPEPSILPAQGPYEPSSFVVDFSAVTLLTVYDVTATLTHDSGVQATAKVYGLNLVHCCKGGPAPWNTEYWNLPNPDAYLTTAPQIPSRAPDARAYYSEIYMFDNGGFELPDGIQDDRFVLRSIKEDYFLNGAYQFTTLSDDGVRVYVDGELVIDEWNDHGATEHSAVVQVTEGYHDVVVEYYENGWDQILRLAIERTDESDDEPVVDEDPVLTPVFHTIHNVSDDATVTTDDALWASFYHTITCDPNVDPCSYYGYDASDIRAVVEVTDTATGDVVFAADGSDETVPTFSGMPGGLGSVAESLGYDTYYVVGDGFPKTYVLPMSVLSSGTYDIQIDLVHENGSTTSRTIQNVTVSGNDDEVVDEDDGQDEEETGDMVRFYDDFEYGGRSGWTFGSWGGAAVNYNYVTDLGGLPGNSLQVRKSSSAGTGLGVWTRSPQFDITGSGAHTLSLDYWSIVRSEIMIEERNAAGEVVNYNWLGFIQPTYGDPAQSFTATYTPTEGAVSGQILIDIKNDPGSITFDNVELVAN